MTSLEGFKLRISKNNKESSMDGPGIRYTIFCQGCVHNCAGCYSKQTHDINGGYFVELNDLLNEIVNSKTIDGVTLSGGEPFLQARQLAKLCEEIKKRSRRELSIITYTGFTLEDLKEGNYYTKKLLEYTDVLIDGKFLEYQRDEKLSYRGSSNQKVIALSKKGEELIEEFRK